MRWIVFAILVWFLTLVQTTVGRALMFETDLVGTIGPDLLAPLAVFVALYVRSKTDAAIAACLMGYALDLTTAGGIASSAVVGPMALAYAAAAVVVFKIRDAFFLDRAITRGLLTLLFCLFSHLLWVASQCVLLRGGATWAEFGRMTIQAVAISLYSAVMAMAMIWLFVRIRRWLVLTPAGGRARRRR